MFRVLYNPFFSLKYGKLYRSHILRENFGKPLMFIQIFVSLSRHDANLKNVFSSFLYSVLEYFFFNWIRTYKKLAKIMRFLLFFPNTLSFCTFSQKFEIFQNFSGYKVSSESFVYILKFWVKIVEKSIF